MRPKSKVFNHFIESVVNEKTIYTSSFCRTIYRFKNATKFALHLSKCEKIPTDLKTLLKLKVILQAELRSSFTPQSHQTNSNNSASTSTSHSPFGQNHNERLWAQHCRVAQVLQEPSIKSPNSQKNNQCESADKLSSSSQNQEQGSSSGRKSVKDIIPESRLAQFYGNFYYDEAREKCYTSTNEKINGYSGQGCQNSDLTECWMLPEVEYWFRRLVDEPADRSVVPRRRRQYKLQADEELCAISLMYRPTRFTTNFWVGVSERWGLCGAPAAGEERALAARVLSVRGLWATTPAAPRRASPPPPSRKMRARRRQPRRLAVLAPLPPAYCVNAPAQLFCDPTCKFQFEAPRPLQATECQRAIGRLSASVQAVMRASAAHHTPYRGTNVAPYAPTYQRARGPNRRYGMWWPRDHLSPRIDHRFQLTRIALQPAALEQKTTKSEPVETVEKDATEKETTIEQKGDTPSEEALEQSNDNPDDTKSTAPEEMVPAEQLPSTSTVTIDNGLRNKRLYSTVLSAPTPLITPIVRLSQKLVAPGLIKLNPKVVLQTTRMHSQNFDNKYEQLEKEALEQYKASDESIETKFHELEKQAEEQYSNSNSNTSCSSGNSAEKCAQPPPPDTESKKQPAKFHKDKAVDSVVIYSQNFPDLNAKHPTSVTNLKNFHTPPRGEKKEQTHRSSKMRSLKNQSQRAASETDYNTRKASKGSHKGLRWALQVGPPKKRHLSLCVSDFSDDELEGAGSVRSAGRRGKRLAGKLTLSAHAGGDLQPILKKT